MLTMLLKDGTISNISGMETIRNMPSVFNVIQYYHEGDTVNAQGRLQQAFARIYITGKDYKDLKVQIEEVERKLQVFDEGKNMLLDNFNSDILIREYVEK